MNTMKSAVLLVALVSSLAHADDQLFTLRRGAPAVIECDSVDALVALASALDNARAKMDSSTLEEVDRLRGKRDCIEGPVDSSELRLSKIEDRLYQGQSYKVGEVVRSDGGKPEYVQMSDLVTYTDPNSDLHRCSALSSGEVDRMEVGKGGQVYLKRYWVSSSCENGVMRSRMKPLN
ncbi:hypothetical protein [Burkholderia anthina]|uniref:hypothetical protein n=1 Tax=Burkholderia anthina TaxID=179879 RepID=UPI0015895C21|nr:hypothetical protein [Burkholderia anthina]